MEAVDNFEAISWLLPEHPKEDLYYIVQLIIRKGTNLNHNNSNRSRSIRTYTIKSRDHLFEYKKEMMYLCDLTGARAYINLNPRSFRRTALRAINLLSNALDVNNEHSSINAYHKAMMDCPIVGPRTWVIDFDLKDYPDKGKMTHAVAETALVIEGINKDVDKVMNKSKTGIHLLTSTFRRDIFLKQIKEKGIKCELKIDASTNLYIPAENNTTLRSDDDFNIKFL